MSKHLIDLNAKESDRNSFAIAPRCFSRLRINSGLGCISCRQFCLMLITSSAIKALNRGFIAMPCMLSGAITKDANIAKAGAFFFSMCGVRTPAYRAFLNLLNLLAARHH